MNKENIPAYNFSVTNKKVKFEFKGKPYLAAYSCHMTMAKYPGIIRGLHSHNFYVIIICHSAHGIHVIDAKEIAFQNRRVFFLYPGQCHSAKGDINVQGDVIVFSEELLAYLEPNLANHIKYDIFNTDGEPSYCDFTSDVQPVLKNKLNEMKNYPVDDADPSSKYLAASFLSEMLLLLEKKSSWNLKRKEARNLQQFKVCSEFKELVNKHFKSMHFVRQYAEEMHLSAISLRKCTKTYADMTPQDIIRQKLVIEAKRMLIKTNKKVCYISLELGFLDDAYFIRFFERETGMSPSEFRDRNQ